MKTVLREIPVDIFLRDVNNERYIGATEDPNVMRTFFILFHRKEEQNFDVKLSRVVFIDSTWNQSRGIYKDPRLFSKYRFYFIVFFFVIIYLCF